MKAITYAAHGAPLGLSEVEEPKIGPDWVKVVVRATSVSPVDWKVAAGGLDSLLDTFFPATPGWDVAGVVESVGPAVTTLVPGDEVFGYVRKDAVHGGTFTYGDGLVDRVRAQFPEGVDAVLDLNGGDLAVSPSLLSDTSFGRLPAGVAAQPGRSHTRDKIVITVD